MTRANKVPIMNDIVGQLYTILKTFRTNSLFGTHFVFLEQVIDKAVSLTFVGKDNGMYNFLLYSNNKI